MLLLLLLFCCIICEPRRFVPPFHSSSPRPPHLGRKIADTRTAPVKGCWRTATGSEQSRELCVICQLQI